MAWLLDHLEREWTMISQAPFAFIGAVLLASAVIFVMVRRFNQAKFNEANALIDLYQKRLGLQPTASTTNVAGRVARPDEAIINQLQEELEAERTQPELRWKISQLYVQPDNIIAIQLSLWNIRKTPTSIQEFRLKVVTADREYEGYEVPGQGLAYVESWDKNEEDACPLDALTLSHRPLPNGYSQGQIEEDRWLCFAVLDIQEIEESKISKIVLTAVDAFGITHKTINERQWSRLGKIVSYYA